MAAVWAARLKGSRGFSKTVAVKTMLPTVSDDPQFEQMFLDEAQIASRIIHPNVVQILDLGEQDDVLYLVMEWVDGEPLSSVRRAAAKKNGIPRPIAVKIVADACAGLHAAHELADENGENIGLVHRDISPQNILLTYQGMIKIVDFGVAKAAGRTSEATSAGQVKGKPPYMSPEQALGNDIDRRTDVFALGIILYQLTTGKHPFRGESDMVTLQNIVSDRPIVSPRAHDKEYPKALEAVIMKALARDPGMRFQTTAEFEAALDRVFPPRIGRVRTEDVGKLVSDLLADRGKERREALKEAIRLADERAAGNEAGQVATRLKPLEEIGSNPGTGGGRASIPSVPGGMLPVPPPPPSVGGTGASLTVVDRPSGPDGVPLETSEQFTQPDTPAYRHSVPSEHPSSPPTTPFSASAPTSAAIPTSSNKGLFFALAGIGVAGVLIVGALVAVRMLGGGTETATAAPATEAPAEPAVEPTPPEPSAAAETDEPAEDEPGEPGQDEPAEPVVDPSDLELEKNAKKGAGGPVGSWKPKAPAKAKEPEKKPVKKPGGFVPPPVSDPGF